MNCRDFIALVMLSHPTPRTLAQWQRLTEQRHYAKGDVTLKFDANTAAFIQKTLAAKNALDDAAEKGRKFGDEVAKGGSKAQSAMDNAAKSVIGMAGSFATIGTAVAVVSAGVNAFFADMAAKAAKARADLQGLAQIQAGGAPQGMTLQQFNQKISAIGGSLTDPSKARELVHSAYSLGPKFNDAEKEAAAKAGAVYSYAYRGGKSSEQEASFIKNFAELKRAAPGSNLPQTTGGLEGLADLMAAHGGLTEEKDLREFNESDDKKGALARILARNESEESKKGYGAIQSAINEGREAASNPEFLKKLHHRHKLTGEDLRKERLLKAFRSGGLNEDAIIRDPSLASPDSQRAISAFGRAYNPAAIDAAAEGQGFNDRFMNTMDFYNTDTYGQRLAGARKTAWRKEKHDQGDAPRSLRLENEQKEFDENLRDMGVENSYAREGLGYVQKGRQLNDAASSNGISPLDTIPGGWGPLLHGLLNAATVRNPSTGEGGEGSPIHKELQKQTAHLEDINSRGERGGDASGRANTTLSNGNEGQK